MFLLTLTWILLDVLLLTCGGLLINAQSSGFRDREALRFATDVGLPLVSDTVHDAVRRHVRVRASAMAVGGTVGLVVSAAVLLASPSLGSASFVWLITAPAILSAMATVEVAVSLRESLFRHRDGVPRVARSSAPTLADYVSLWRLRLAPVCELVAVILCAVGVALGILGSIDLAAFLGGAALPFLLVSLVVAAASMVAQRRILRESQPVSDTLELAWDDAFRGETLRGLRMVQSLIAWLAVAAAGLGILQALDALVGTNWGTGAGPQLFTWGWLFIFAAFTFGRARTQFRARLWPDVAGITEGRSGMDSERG
ncbi:MAG: hypothetical protein V4531_07520 [Actinomycetota bacterium]